MKLGRKAKRLWPHQALMPKPTAPIWFGDQCYACNPRGLHVPLATLSVDQMRDAISYRGEVATEYRRAA